MSPSKISAVSPHITRNTWPAFGGGGKDAECILNNRTIGKAAWSAMPPVKDDAFADVPPDEKGIPVTQPAVYNK